MEWLLHDLLPFHDDRLLLVIQQQGVAVERSGRVFGLLLSRELRVLGPLPFSSRTSPHRIGGTYMEATWLRER